MSDYEIIAKELNVKLDGLSSTNKYKALKKAMADAKIIGKSIQEYAGEIVARGTKKPDARVEVIKDSKVEVLPPTSPGPTSTNSTSNHRVEVAAPSIVMNVPAPIVNVGHQEAPKWWQIVGLVKDAALYMVLGASMWALLGGKVIGKLVVASVGGV